MRRNKASNVIYVNLRFGGKTFRQSLKTSDKTLARNRLAEFRRQLESGKIDQEEHTTVKVIAEKYLLSLAPMSKSEQVRSKGYIKLLSKKFGGVDPRKIRSMEIQEWLNALREERGFGEDSYNKYVACIKDFFVFLIKNHFASENPITGFDFLKAKAIRKYTPSTQEVRAVINHVRKRPFSRQGKNNIWDNDETADFIEFMALTGQGRAEVEHFIWQDVLWELKKLNFYRQKTRAKAHTMPLFPAVRTFLQKRWKNSEKKLLRRVFKIKNCKRALSGACEAQGITKLGHHSFRRYFITERLMEGVPPNIVAKWVGHTNSDMVMEIYSSIPTSFEERFANNIPALK